MEERFVTVYRAYDAVQVRMLADVLHQNGIAARLMNAGSPASLGLGSSALEARIDVPLVQLDEARELIDAFMSAPRVDGELDEPDEDERDDEDRKEAEEEEPLSPETVPPRLRPILAIGIAAVFPGGSHLYARRKLTGVALLVGMVVSIVACAAGRGDSSLAAAVAQVSMFVFDLVGGQLAVRAYNRGLRPRPWQQLVVSAVVLFGTGLLGMLSAPSLSRLKPPRRAADAPRDSDSVYDSSGVDDLPFPLHIDYKNPPGRRKR